MCDVGVVRVNQQANEAVSAMEHFSVATVLNQNTVHSVRRPDRSVILMVRVQGRLSLHPQCLWRCIFSGPGLSVSSFNTFLTQSFFFFCVPQLYLWGSPFLGEIFAYVTVFLIPKKKKRKGSHIPSSWMVRAGCVFVAGIHPSRT